MFLNNKTLEKSNEIDITESSVYSIAILFKSSRRQFVSFKSVYRFARTCEWFIRSYSDKCFIVPRCCPASTIFTRPKMYRINISFDVSCYILSQLLLPLSRFLDGLGNNWLVNDVTKERIVTGEKENHKPTYCTQLLLHGRSSRRPAFTSRRLVLLSGPATWQRERI